MTGLKMNVHIKVGQMQGRPEFFKLYVRPICWSWINSSIFLSEMEYLKMDLNWRNKWNEKNKIYQISSTCIWIKRVSVVSWRVHFSVCVHACTCVCVCLSTGSNTRFFFLFLWANMKTMELNRGLMRYSGIRAMCYQLF